MITPDFVGQHYRDTTTGNIWVANSTTPGDWSLLLQNMHFAWTPDTSDVSKSLYYSTADGVDGAQHLTIDLVTSMGVSIVSEANLQTISLPNLISVDALDLESYDNGFSSCPNLISISAPNLQTISGALAVANCAALASLNLSSLQQTTYGGITLNTLPLSSLDLSSLVSVGGDLSITNLQNLLTIDLSSLQTVSGGFNVVMCSLLNSINLPSLTTSGDIHFTSLSALTNIDISALTSGGDFIIADDDSPLLSTIDVSGFLPVNTKEFRAHGCALTETTVNSILARHVANPAYASGTIDLAGGTSSAPTGQGIIDKATLALRGVGVGTN